MQKALSNFSKMHRRDALIGRIEDESIPDLEKHQYMKSLFQIEFLPHEAEQFTVEGTIQYEVHKAMKDSKEISRENVEARKCELGRTRNAALYFHCEKSKNQADSIAAGIAQCKLANPQRAEVQVEKQFRRNLESFPILRTADLPDLSAEKSRGGAFEVKTENPEFEPLIGPRFSIKRHAKLMATLENIHLKRHPSATTLQPAPMSAKSYIGQRANELLLPGSGRSRRGSSFSR